MIGCLAILVTLSTGPLAETPAGVATEDQWAELLVDEVLSYDAGESPWHLASDLSALGSLALDALARRMEAERGKAKLTCLDAMADCLARRPALTEDADRVVPVLERALDDHTGQVRLAAAKALVAFPTPWSNACRQALFRIADSPDAQVRLQALSILQTEALSPQIVSVFRHAVQPEHSREERAFAVQVLLATGDPEAAAEVVRQVDADDAIAVFTGRPTRYEMARQWGTALSPEALRLLRAKGPRGRALGLALLRDVQPLPDPEEALDSAVRALSDPDADVRSEAPSALSTLNDLGLEAAPAILRILREAKDNDALLAACNAFCQITSAESVPTLLGLLTHDDEHVREAAVSALTRQPCDAGFVLQAMGDARSSIRARAAWGSRYAIDRDRDAEVLAGLRRIASTPDSPARVEAIGALVCAEDALAWPAIHRGLHDPDYRARAAICNFFRWEQGDPRWARGAVRAVADRLSDPSPSVRSAAERALSCQLSAAFPYLWEERRTGGEVLGPRVPPAYRRLLTRATGTLAKAPPAAGSWDEAGEALAVMPPGVGAGHAWVERERLPRGRLSGGNSIAIGVGLLGAEIADECRRVLRSLPVDEIAIATGLCLALSDYAAPEGADLPVLVRLLESDDERATGAAVGWVTDLYAPHFPLGELQLEPTPEAPPPTYPEWATPLIAPLTRLAECSGRPREAMEALSQSGARARSAVPAIASRLSDPDAEVRAVAAYALAFIGSPNDRILSHLRSLAFDPHAQPRAGALHALYALGDQRTALRILDRRLHHPLAAIRQDALSQAAWLTRDGSLPDGLRDAITQTAHMDEDAGVRKHAAEVLAGKR